MFTKFDKDLMKTLLLREWKPCGRRLPNAGVPIIRPVFQMGVSKVYYFQPLT